jgi:hypothetical protein
LFQGVPRVKVERLAGCSSQYFFENCQTAHCQLPNSFSLNSMLQTSPLPVKTLTLPLQKNTNSMSFRTEHDTMGEVQVPADKYWGAQTERSRNNFKIGPEASMPKEIIAAFAYLKKAAAYTNTDWAYCLPKNAT